MKHSGIYVYVSQHGSARISALCLDRGTGALTPVQDVDAGGAAMPMAISPDRRFLHVGLRDDPDWRVASFAIDGRDGTLAPLGTAPAADSTVYLSTDRTGRFLLAANNPRGADRPAVLCINPIGPDGWVQAPFAIVPTPPKLHAVLPDPANRFLFATSCDGDAILRYAFDAVNGVADAHDLDPVALDPGRGPRHLAFHPNGRFLYVVNEYDGSICMFRYAAADGMLHQQQIVSALPPGYVPGERHGRGISAAAADIRLTPDGRRLYASVRGSLTIAGFVVDPASGRLAGTGHTPAPNEPRGFAIDPFGDYLLAAGDQDDVLVTYRIGRDSGALERVAELPVGSGPNWVECIRLP